MIYQKSNGLVVAADPRNIPTAFLFACVGLGGIHDPVDGVSHFLEHMIFKGTEKWPSEIEVNKAIDGLGAEINAYTYEDKTFYFINGSAKFIPQMIGMLSQFITKPILSSKTMESERTVIYREIDARNDDPSELMYERIFKLLFENKENQTNIIGTHDSVALITEKMLKHWHSIYGTKNIIVGMIGNIKHEHNDLAEQISQALPLGNSIKNWVETSKTPKAFAVINKQGLELSRLGISWKCFGEAYEKSLIMQTLTNILGNAWTSYLWNEIRVKRGLAYNTYAYYKRFGKTGALCCCADVAHDKIDETKEIILQCCKKICQEVSEDHLELIKNKMIGSRDVLKSYPFSWAETIARKYFNGVDLNEIENDYFEERLAKITKNDVVNLANEIIDLENYVEVRVVPE